MKFSAEERTLISARYSPIHNDDDNQTTMASPLGVPVKLLHEALGHVITVELKTGQMYRGKLQEGQHLVR